MLHRAQRLEHGLLCRSRVEDLPRPLARVKFLRRVHNAESTARARLRICLVQHQLLLSSALSATRVQHGDPHRVAEALSHRIRRRGGRRRGSAQLGMRCGRNDSNHQLKSACTHEDIGMCLSRLAPAAIPAPALMRPGRPGCGCAHKCAIDGGALDPDHAADAV